MLGKTIYRTDDRDLAASLFSALTSRYPTKGLELTRDGNVHLIRAAGNTDVVEAFVAGSEFMRERACMVGIHGDGESEMSS